MAFDWYRSGNVYRPHAAPYVYDTITNQANRVQSQHIETPDGLGTFAERINLSDYNGSPLIPQEALSFTVACHLYRGVADSNGNADVSFVSFLPGYQNIMYGQPPGVYGADFNTFGTAAMSGANPGQQPVGDGTLVESLGREAAFPNVTEGNDWGVFYVRHRGITLLGAGAILRLTSFEIPANYTLPDPWPAAPAPPPPPAASLELDFAGNLNDASPNDHAITGNNISFDNGSAVFDGSSSYLSFDGAHSSLTLDGDFTIEMQITTTVKTLQNGSQRRLLSFGSGNTRIGIYIDHNTGAIGLLREYIALLHGGAANVTTGNPITIKWTRVGGVNRLYINGQQDGASFNDATVWIGAAPCEIGRLNGSGQGYFSGKIGSLKVTKGTSG
jgi:hypothetical protein